MADAAPGAVPTADEDVPPEAAASAALAAAAEAEPEAEPAAEVVPAAAAARNVAPAEPEPEAELEPDPGAAGIPASRRGDLHYAPAGLESSKVSGARAVILAELLALGQELLANMPSYKLMAQDPAREHEARKTYLPGRKDVPVTCVRLRADGFTMEHVARFYGDFDNTLPVLVPEMALTPLCVDEGAATRWLRLKLPKPLTPRTTISSSYKIYNPDDGSFIWLVSSKGNEEIYKAEVAAGRIKKKDVQGIMHIDYNLFQPRPDGSMTCTKIICMDPGGSVPDAAKRQMAKRQVEGHQGLIDWVLTGKLPAS